MSKLRPPNSLSIAMKSYSARVLEKYQLDLGKSDIKETLSAQQMFLTELIADYVVLQTTSGTKFWRYQFAVQQTDFLFKKCLNNTLLAHNF